jgi:hypothetical protein
MALQISGTTVINNSRNLQNITSVDATTAASIATAGVGGAMSLINTYTIPSGGTNSYTYTFPTGYDTFIVEATKLFGTNNTITYPTLKLSAANGYVYGTNGYWRADFDNASIAQLHSFFGDNQFYGYANNNGTGSSFYATIRYPRNATVWTHGLTFGSNYDGRVRAVKTSMNLCEDNRDFNVSTWSNTFSVGGVIKLWGIK